jgi:hypothetical protein
VLLLLGLISMLLGASKQAASLEAYQHAAARGDLDNLADILGLYR